MKKIIFVFAAWLATFSAQAQSSYSGVDSYVDKLGSLDSLNVARIADTLTRPFADKEKKARAIFYWIAHHIAMDPKQIRANDNKKSDPVLVVQFRKATSMGFANLFQEMCSMASIRCLVVDGYVKLSTDDIGNPADAVNHSWNVVQLGQSADEWFYVDAARASGAVDKKLTIFTPSFCSNYFFAEKNLFNLDHYPDNKAWQLGTGPKSLKEFYDLPVLFNDAYVLGLLQPSPAIGYVKTKMSNAVRFSFSIGANQSINTVSLIIGDGNRALKPEPMNFSSGGGQVSFTYQFKRDDVYPVKIMVNDKPVLGYMLDVKE
jgi:transglutaminase/protease-like cytokinesis protein 3